MIIIGITGSIGCGKSTVSSFFTRFGNIVLDADLIVSKLYKQDKIIKQIEKMSPKSVENGVINRSNLFSWISANNENRKNLEKLIHTEVRKQIRNQILKLRFIKPFGIVILDIPLLFEGSLHKICNYSIGVYCSESDQERRVMKRNNMTLEKFQYLKSQQFSQEKKKALSDFVINTSIAKIETIRQVKTVIRYVRNEQGCSI